MSKKKHKSENNWDVKSMTLVGMVFVWPLNLSTILNITLAFYNNIYIYLNKHLYGICIHQLFHICV